MIPKHEADQDEADYTDTTGISHYTKQDIHSHTVHPPRTVYQNVYISSAVNNQYQQELAEQTVDPN